jgi:colanic acid/amylovoran biosynthesis glycosyltransferase
MTPRVAVIVPVRDDAANLDALLTLVGRQTYPADKTDVIVAVDGSDAATVAVVRRHGATVVTLSPAAGSYAARNRALDQLADDVEVVVFTDADCRPVPGWLQAHVSALEHSDMVGGAIRVTLRPRPTPAEFVDRMRHLRQWHYVTNERYAATANLAVRRAVIDSMRFDSQLQTGGDVEFGRRATTAGFSLAYSADAQVDHPARETTADLMRKIDRIRGGMLARRAYWQGREIPRARLRREVMRQARRERVSGNPIWWIRAMWLEFRCQRLVVASAVEAGAIAVAPKRPLTVAYIVDRPAELTQTFVTGELDELRRQGARVVMVAVRVPRNASAPELPTVILHRPNAGRLRLRTEAAAERLLHPRRWRSYQDALGALSSEVDGDGVPQRALPYAARWLRKQHVQVLHAHFAWRGAAAAMCLSRLTGLPWSMTMHANDIFSERRNLEPKLADATRLVTVCDYNLRFLRDELGVTRPVDLVVCGVEVPQERAIPPHRPVVVAVGRLVEKKGFDLLVAATAQLRDAHRDLVVRIIGEGPLEQALREQVARLGVEQHVEFVGSRDHEKTLVEIAGATVLCLPARVAASGDRDSMPVVVKEAMAAGVPVVATDVVGIPEMVDDTVGRLVPPDDVDALSRALDDVLRLTPSDRAALGDRGRQRIQEQFTMGAQVAKLRAVLADMAEVSR